MTANSFRDEMICNLWNAGKTSGEIASHMGLTRNAVMGVIHRAREKGVELMTHEGLFKQKVAVTRPVKSNLELKKSNSGRTVVVKKARPMARDFEKLFGFTENVKGGVGILDLGLFSCRYIVEGTGVDAVYCGKRTASRVYCDEHHEICYVPVQPKKRGRLTPFRA
jgi:hypothetical protein